MNTLFVLLLIAADLRGEVRDQKDGTPLAGVSVYLLETGESAISEADGTFKFENVPTGTLRIAAIDPAYEKKEITATITSSTAAAAPIVLELASNLLQGNEILVEVERNKPAPGATALRREEVTRIPGARGDLLSAVKSLPGVANNGAIGPDSGGLIIRGSSPDDSVILVDGFEIPILYHFGSIASVLPSEMIDDLVYEPGGFGVDVGRATGGTVSVTSRTGDQQYGGFAEFSFINGGALAKGPISEDATFAVAARRSLIDLLLPAVLPADADLSFTTMPRYYDYQARLEWSPRPRHHLSLFGFGTDDKVELISSATNASDPLAARSFQNRTRFTRGIASWKYDGDNFQNRLAFSLLDSLFHFEVGADRYLDLATRSGTVRNESELRLAKGLDLSFGTELELRAVTINIKAPRAPREGDQGDPSFTRDPVIEAHETPTVGLLAGWTALKIEPTSWLSFSPGVRFDLWTRKTPDEIVVQPRLQAEAKLDEVTSIRGAAGYYARPPVNDENLQDNIESERALQTTLGVERELFDGLSLQTTGFFNQRSNLVVYASDRSGSGDLQSAYTNDGTGQTYGAELMVRARFDEFFGWVAYTLSRSTRTDGADAEERLFDFDQTHNLVVVASYALGDESEWRLGARFQYTSGRPYTPVNGSVLLSDSNIFSPIFGATNSQRYGGQHQLDLRIDRTFKFEDWSFSAYLDVTNVYMNAAVLEYDYNYDYTEIEEFTNLPILPSIGLRGEF